MSQELHVSEIGIAGFLNTAQQMIYQEIDVSRNKMSLSLKLGNKDLEMSPYQVSISYH